MDRRTFLETSTLIAGSGARGGAPRAARAEPPMVGIQVGAVSFVDEGTDKVLDGFQEMAGINTLFLATFTYGRGIAGRQLRGQPLPDHGKQEYDDNFRGGNFATPHPQYYRHTSIAPEKAPDHPSYDVIADVLPAAHRRGMKVICWFEDVFRRDVPGFDQAAEIDLHDKPTGRRRVRDVLAPAGQVSGAARVGATVERGAQRRLPGPASAREECRPGEGCRLAYLAQQFVFTAVPRGAGLRRVRQLFGLPEGRDVQQLRRPAAWAIHSKHPCDAARGPDTRTGPGLHLRRPAISRAAARSHRRTGPLSRLRVARDEARGRGRRAARQDLAGDRHRHPYGAGREEDPARGRVPGGARGVPGGRSRRAAVAEVLGDEAREHSRRGTGGARAETGVTAGSPLLLRTRHSGSASQRNWSRRCLIVACCTARPCLERSSHALPSYTPATYRRSCGDARSAWRLAPRG